MNNASSRNLALSSLTGPEPQQKPLLHAIMSPLSPWCSCRGGPVAWWSRIKRTVHRKKTKAPRNTVKLLSMQVVMELSKAVGAFCLRASLCSSSPNRSAKRVICSSPQAALLGLGGQDAQRGAESHGATC